MSFLSSYRLFINYHLYATLSIIIKLSIILQYYLKLGFIFLFIHFWRIKWAKVLIFVDFCLSTKYNKCKKWDDVVMSKQYKDLLSCYIRKSGLSLRQIARRCRDRGQHIDSSYISKLQNGHLPPPSEDVSRVLADVLGGNSDVFVYLGYIAKAPAIIRQKLYYECQEIPYETISLAHKILNLSPRYQEKIITEILLLEELDTRELTS